MRYHDGSLAKLGDMVVIALPDGNARARVVMLGDTSEHVDIEAEFLQWVLGENVLEPSQVVVEWIGPNPLAHDDLQHAPVGNYMFTDLDSCVTRVDG